MMNGWQMLLCLSCFAALLTAPSLAHEHNRPANEFLLNKQLVAAKTPALCEDICRLDDQCEAFYVFNPQEPKIAAWPCYTLSKTMRALVTSFPVTFFQANKGCYGVKVHDAAKLKGSKTSPIDPALRGEELLRHANYLVNKQLVVTSKTLLTQAQQFVKGCSYSLAVWVWIWNKTPRSQSFQAVLSSHEPYPNVGDKNTLLPAIVFNVGLGKQKDQFFFSMARGKHGDDFLGIWAGKVKYRQWTHLALTVEENVLKVYQDGQFLDYLRLEFTVENSPTKKEEQETANTVVPYCGLERDHMMITRCVETNSSDGRNLHWGEVQASRASRIPNVIMWLGGARKKDTRMTGMLQDFVQFENTVLTQKDVTAVMDATRPASSQSSFDKLLDFYSDDHQAYGMCETRWFGNFYEMMAWGVCPEEVCGEVCFTTAFLGQPELNATTVSNMQVGLLAKRGMSKDTDLATLASLDEKKVQSSAAFVPDIGHVKPLDHRTIRMKHGGTSVPAAVWSHLLRNSHLGPVVEAISQRLDAIRNHSFIRSGIDLMLNRTDLAPKVTKTDVGSDLQDANSRFHQWTLDRKQDGYYLMNEEGRIQGLYKLAMSVLQGQHAAQHLHSFNSSFSEWGSNATDMSQSALSLAAMLADEVFTNTAQNMEGDVSWSFEYYKHLSQPILLALGNRMGVEGDIETFTGRDVLHKLSQKGYTLPPIHAINALTNLSYSQPDSNRFREQSLLHRIAKQAFPTLVKSKPHSSFFSLLDKVTGRKDGNVKQFNSGAKKHSSDVSLTGQESLWGRRSPPGEETKRTLHSVTDDHVSSVGEKPLFDMFIPVTLSTLQEALKEEDSSVIANILQHELLYHEAVSDENPSKHQANALAAASYYFPIAQYVTAHYGLSHAGVGILEEVRLMTSKGKVQGYSGEEDSSHQLTEFDALAGDAEAQTWLGKKYFWGLGGLQRNEQMAREWFERAAEQNHPEGLYNLGCFFANGQGGVARDPQQAMELFRRAANADKPFFMAVNAVAQHYMTDKEGRNYTAAKEYLLKAADMGSDDALFSLATIAREGLVGAVDIPLSVYYLSQAATNGHTRSASFLSHGLYDSNSWYSQFGREQLASLRNRVMLDVLNRSSIDISEQNTSHQDIFADNSTASLYDNLVQYFTNHQKDRKTSDTPKHKTLQEYNASVPVHIILRDGHVIKLPYPVGSSGASHSLQHTNPEASLAMLRYISQMSYRTADLSHTALKAFLQEENYVLAATLFEEAADLGLASAQENSAYLFERLQEDICANVTNSGNIDADDAVANCNRFFETMAMRRWLQLAKVGEPFALRKVAERILRNHRVLASPTLNIATDFLLSSVTMKPKPTKPEQPLDILREFTVEHAVDFLTIAARMGSTESLVDLGWLVHHGGVGNQTANADRAMEIFQIALRMESQGYHQVLNSFLSEQRKADLANNTETSLVAVSETHYLPPLFSEYKSTGGLAPAIAIGMVLTANFLHLFSGGNASDIWPSFSSSLLPQSYDTTAASAPLQHKRQVVLVAFLAITIVTIILLYLLWLLWKLL